MEKKKNKWKKKKTNKEIGYEVFKLYWMIYRDEENNEKKGRKTYTEWTTLLIGKDIIALARELAVR